MMKHVLGLIAFGVLCFGCSGNPTNEPDAAAINDAVKKKFEAIDNDPNMTPEQKAEMKKHMGGPVSEGGDANSGRR